MSKSKITLFLFLTFNSLSMFIFGQFEEIKIDANTEVSTIFCQDTFCLVSDNKDGLFITENLGLSFRSIQVPIDTMNPIITKGEIIHMLDSVLCFMRYGIGQTGFIEEVFVSKDFGNNWDLKLSHSGGFGTLTILNFVSDSTLFAGGTSGERLVSYDLGESWIDLNLTHPSGTHIFSADFPSHDNGYVGAAFAAGKTTNQGETYFNGFGISDGVRDIKAANNDTAFLITGISKLTGDIFRTIDCGDEWELIFSNDDFEFSIIESNKESGIIYILGKDAIRGKALIVSTEDYGESWQNTYVPFDKRLYSIGFANDSIAFIGGDEGYFAKWNMNQHVSNNNFTLLEWSNLKIYPNPHTEYFFLITDDTASFKGILNIYDIAGRWLLSEKIVSNNQKVNTSNLQSGSYFISVLNDQKKVVYRSKFIKL